MKSFRGVYLNKKGLCLLELILGICITSILLMCFYSILIYTINISKISDENDIVLSNGRYALLYIKDEIKHADKIVHISKFENLNETFPQNIGFVILEKTTETSGKTNNNYKTYYLKNNCLVRLACNTESFKYPSKDSFGGYNELCKGISSLEKFNYDTNKNILNIKLSLKDGTKDFEFKSDIYLNCPVDLNDEE